jgi:hypothetical protein
MDAGVFQFSHSFSNRPTLQEKPDPQFSPVQFHESDDVETLTRFVMAAKHGHPRLQFEQGCQNTNPRIDGFVPH